MESSTPWWRDRIYQVGKGVDISDLKYDGAFFTWSYIFGNSNRNYHMPLTYGQYVKIKRFPGLDGLRAVAVLMVIGSHMEDKFLYWLDGRSGVSIFFVLSG